MKKVSQEAYNTKFITFHIELARKAEILFKTSKVLYVIVSSNDNTKCGKEPYLNMRCICLVSVP